MSDQKIAIIGAGPSGLYLSELLKAEKKEFSIFEKSKNTGGRIAHRRFQDLSLDFGAAELSGDYNEMDDWNLKILDESGNSLNQKVKNYYTKVGISIEFEKELERLSKNNKQNNWNCIFKDGSEENFDTVVLSCPAPQTQEILEKSNMDASFLSFVEYDKKILYMAQGGEEDQLKRDFRCVGKKSDFIIWEYQKEFIDKSRADIKKEFDLIYKPNQSFAHKWKYSQVKKTLDPQFIFHFQDHSLYLIGDYFFGRTVADALKSAKKLFEVL